MHTHGLLLHTVKGSWALIRLMRFGFQMNTLSEATTSRSKKLFGFEMNTLSEATTSHSKRCRRSLKVASNPVTLKVDKPGIQADRFLCLAKLLARNQFWESQTVHCP